MAQHEKVNAKIVKISTVRAQYIYSENNGFMVVVLKMRTPFVPEDLLVCPPEK